MIRAAIYARYSSDLQSDRSIEDQIALCLDVCQRNGFAIVLKFDDRAISGTSTANRPGFQAMMRAAEARAFDVLVAEGVDRISRDQGDWHAARKRLDFLGIAIHTATGQVGKLDGALRALMGEMYIENLIIQTRRGMEGVLRDGRHAGGRAYGYRAVAGKPGELEIVETEADVVRRIFAEYIAGKSPRDIAADLNRSGVQPPRGARWNGSTINGNMQRGHGMLLNEIYIGRIAWNKVRMVKDPASGKRISRPNPPDQWRIADAPHLRIIGDDLWQAAQARKGVGREAGAIGGRARRPHKERRVLSGLLRCAACGGGLTSIGERKGTARLQCSTYKESGTCTNGRRIKRDDVERLALDSLRAELSRPAYLVEYVKAYNEERKRLARDAGNARGKLEQRRGEIERELNRASDAIIKHGVDPAPLAPIMNRLKAERDEIDGKLAAIKEGENVITLHPAAIERYRRDLEKLAALLPLGEIGDGDELAQSVRRLVAEVIVHAPADSEKLDIEIRGRLEELLEAPAAFSRRSRGGALLVAGEGLEPPTPGL
ncbi:recombinase family protein [Bradyrhizobium sp. SZCCHNR1020]|uniref:recombinase family protein n=1 Tax=Bradyrhizobium sp. SZCCHNR1020 TaxID=3057343 RepID=UPI00396751FD